ncbi:F-box protein CPR1-like [Gastrolobium bilobum]|uniref:F-box protein CPR1-like n=1 Tax=Gastrolobium bilobum TaxID=150636 RepID=UPI002AB081B8|nr:F-box protein CPR1-like [Gastrolobium bilobum]
MTILFLICIILILFRKTPINWNKTRYSQFPFRRVQREMGSMEHLPRELVSNILSRLPTKVLLRCKLVCKSWFDLITDPHFITNYYFFYNNLMHFQSQEEQLLVIRRPFLSGLKTYISVLSWNIKQPKGLVSSEVLNPPYEYNSDHKYWTEILGPCNGVYFLEGNPNVIMNPSLRQFRALPESHFTCPIGTYSFTYYAGFGFDTKTNDYKVVVIKDLWLKETDERKLGYWTAELYSLNSNSWRKLDVSLPLPIEIWGSSRVYTYVNNCCHWWGYVDEFGRIEDVVLAFDMVNEVFRKIKVPRIRCSSEEDFATLAPFNESATIGFIVYPVRGTDKCFDVWVMKDYWDEGSWIKQYTVGPTEVIYKLVGFYGSNRFLWKDSNERLVLYECDSEQTRDLQVYGKYDSIRAARYMESLVSLERENEYSHQCFSCSLVPDPLLNQRE